MKNGGGRQEVRLSKLSKYDAAPSFSVKGKYPVEKYDNHSFPGPGAYTPQLFGAKYKNMSTGCKIYSRYRIPEAIPNPGPGAYDTQDLKESQSHIVPEPVYKFSKAKRFR